MTHNWWGIYLPISCEFLPLSSLYTNQWKKSTKLFHWRFMCRWGHPVSPKRRQRNHVIPPSESAKISQAFFRKLPGVSDSSEDLLPLRKAVAEPVLHGSFLVSVLHAVPVLCNHNGSNYIRQHRRKPVPVPLLLSSVQILLFRSVCFLTS